MQKAILLMPSTAKGASTSSEEQNAQISPRKSTGVPESTAKPCGLLVPSSFLTLAHVSLSVSPSFSPLSLRHSFVVVCFEVTICELLCLDGLRHVISGILAWGSLFPDGAFVASFTFWYGLVI